MSETFRQTCSNIDPRRAQHVWTDIWPSGSLSYGYNCIRFASLVYGCTSRNLIDPSFEWTYAQNKCEPKLSTIDSHSIFVYKYLGNVEIYWLIEEYYNYLMRIMSTKNESKYPGNVHHLRGSFDACLWK